MGLDIRVQVLSAKDGTTVFDAELRQRGTCLFDALPPEVWNNLTEIEGESNYTHIYELPKEKLKRAKIHKILNTEYDEYTRLAHLLRLLIMLFPHDYTIKFGEY